ncbi:MAG: TIGR03936 family radical SAM-associated protein [Clostridia bacterium]|nr:TIGR03936 family radical SAM-associated protein [Clostridia bacterium]
MRALIRFGKRDRLRFISHLDLQRFFQRAVNRTGLPVAWSQGFNPHPVMSFGSALALGWTSEYEVIDIKLSAPMGRKRTEDAVRAALPEDLPVLEVRMIDDKHPAPMALVRMSDYLIALEGDDARRVYDQVPAFLDRERVMGIKKTKSGEKEIDIRPLAKELKETDAGLYARLMLTEQNTLKPDLLVKALADMAVVGVPEMRIHRLTLLGADAAGDIRPLMAL